jgi:hypothetical protein
LAKAGAGGEVDHDASQNREQRRRPTEQRWLMDSVIQPIGMAGAV